MSATSIHPTAVIEDGAELAPDVIVGAFAYVGPMVKLGPGCRLHHHASVEGNTFMGERNEVFPYALIGGRTQDKKWTGDEAPVIIGDDNIFREYCSVHPATFKDKATAIGSRNLFCAYSHIGHECRVGNDCIFSNNATLGGHVCIGDHVIIGGLTAVHQFCQVGGGAMIGGCCKVLQDVLPHALAEGYPATHRTINKVGMQRCGFDEEAIQIAARIHKLFFRKGLNKAQAIKALEAGELGTHALVEEALAFARRSERGLA
ncbi:acyl-ACP--UDP-N-acetylglucosamine O-acyltransferase [Puniceicoccales bacterium CK1056]|uniref:Acyl-ACP--UDP-N-acetylglucosamine O-acyltransferase n=1 Tax=Oceanipulchritudo coccoides TaxID=2706888 RepID=A0A6B2M293_9BACT|nr:acyl-ACP--UDP-N-acetylglucosamine O-acyltransferase [Oceanipulchritudo coccoides]NDV62496.1 acyl-ACP--UDP-N-acetylglucosamine O-acyltransferase [Oceanipulchritudo coccoides]